MAGQWQSGDLNPGVSDSGDSAGGQSAVHTQVLAVGALVVREAEI